MPKSGSQKRYEGIRRQLSYWGGDYHKMPTHIKSQCRNAFMKLEPSWRWKLIKEFDIKREAGTLFFFDDIA